MAQSSGALPEVIGKEKYTLFFRCFEMSTFGFLDLKQDGFVRFKME